MEKSSLLSVLPGTPSVWQVKCAQAVTRGNHLIFTSTARSGKSALIAAVSSQAEDSQTLVMGLSRQRALRKAVQSFRVRSEVSSNRVDADPEFEAMRGVLSVRGGKVDTVAGFAIRTVNDAAKRQGNPQIRLATEGETATWVQQASEGVDWGAASSALARASQQFENELLEAVNRARDYSISPEQLRQMSQEHPSWSGVADVLENLVFAQEKRRTDSRQGSWALDVNGLLDHLIKLLDTGALQVGRDLPQLILVDDLHEVTTQVLDFLEKAASRGAQIVASVNPDVATAVFRGGVPRAGIELSERLKNHPRQLVELVDNHPLNIVPAELHHFYSAVVSQIETAGEIRHRHAPEPLELPDETTGDRRIGENLRLVVGKSEDEQLEQLAQWLAYHHIYDQIPWDEMAFIVRTSSDIDSARSCLAYYGIPVQPVRRATILNDGLFSGPLLRLTQLVSSEAEPSREIIERELTSHLLGLDRWKLNTVREPDVWQLFESGRYSAAGGQTQLQGWDDQLAQLKSSGSKEHGSDQTSLHTARCVWEFGWVWGKLHAEFSAGKIGLEQLLWELWDSLGHAKQWQIEALDPEVNLYRRQQLNDGLDQIMDLFKTAQWWVQRNPNTDITEFLSQQLHSEVPLRSVAPHGQTEPGVALTTPALAAGQHWRLVAVCGVFGRKWPQLTRHDQILNAAGDTLAAGLEGSEIPSGRTWPDTQIQSIWYAEARQLAAAVSRATEHLIVGTVSGADQNPSPFLSTALNRWATNPEKTVTYLNQHTTPPPKLSTITDVITSARKQSLAKVKNPDSESLAELTQISQTLSWLGNHGFPQAIPNAWVDCLPCSPVKPKVHSSVYISPSGIQRLIDNPAESVLQDLGGINSAEESPHLDFGNLVHTIAQNVTERLWSAQTTTLQHYERQIIQDELEKEYASLSAGNQANGWVERYWDERMRKTLNNLGAFMVNHQFRSYCEYKHQVSANENSENKIRVTNYRFTNPREYQIISNIRIDRLMIDDKTGTLTIVDYKTGNPKNYGKTQVNTNLQMAFYQLIAESDDFINQLNSKGIRYGQIKAMIVPLEEEKEGVTYTQIGLDEVLPKLPAKIALSAQDKCFLTNPGVKPRTANNTKSYANTTNPASLESSKNTEYTDLLKHFQNDNSPAPVNLRNYLMERLGIAATIKTNTLLAAKKEPTNPTYPLKIQEWRNECE